MQQVEGVQIYQKDSDAACVEVRGVAATAELDSNGSGRSGAYEMGTGRVAELPTGDIPRVDCRQGL
jgi:hypothetical protein